LINNRPNLTPLYKSSETVGSVLKKGDIVIYESTVYPGVTEEECVPVLERVSGLQFNVDFLQAILLNALIPATKNIRLKKFLKSRLVLHQKQDAKLMHYINRLLLRERIWHHR
jgi:UDP-N-acetyl-D-galactosamine dehydrogenase